MAIPTVNFISFNSTGIASDKCDFINDICEENDVYFVSIQEHFKNSKTVDKYFCKKFPKYNSYVIPGYRPYGQDTLFFFFIRTKFIRTLRLKLSKKIRTFQRL